MNAQHTTMHFFRMSFQRKLLTFFLLFSIVTLVSVALIVYETVRARYQEVLINSFSEQARLEERIVSNLLDSNRFLAQSLAAQQFLLSETEKASAGEPFDEDLLFLTLVAVRRENQFIEAIHLIDQHGTVVISTASSDRGRSYATSPFFIKPLQSRTSYVGEVFDNGRQARVLPIATTLLRRSDNMPIGVLLIELNIAAINAVVSEVAGVRTEAGLSIYAADFEGKLLTLLPGHGLGTTLATAPIDLCRTAKHPLTGTWVGESGEEVVGVSRCFNYSDARWTIVLEQSAYEAFRISRELGGIILLITFELGLLLIFVTLRLASSITRPIQTLRREAKAIGEGDFEYAVEVKTGDEIEELADEFEQARRLLKTARDREQYLGRMKSEFISIAAHQLRTPLTAMRWGLEELAKTVTKEGERTYVMQAKQSAEQLIRIVNDLLNITRIEEGKFDYSFKEGSLLTLLKKVAEELAPRISARGLRYSIVNPSDTLPRMAFDEEKIEMVFFNILDNAIRYTQPGGSITTSFEIRPASVIISVADTGIGIPREALPNLFSKFYRAKNAILMEPSGSGLGLYVIRQIVEAHGGVVDIISRENEGTTARVTLPIAHAKLKAR